MCGYACGKREADGLVAESDGWGQGTVDLEDQLEEGHTEVAACGVAREDDVGRGHGGVYGAWRWVEKGEISEESVEEGGGERRLRGETVANGEAAATSKVCQFGCRATVGRWIAEVVGTTVEVEDGGWTRDFGHKSLVMLGFSEIRARTV